MGLDLVIFGSSYSASDLAEVELRYLNDYTGNLIGFIKEAIFKLNKLATHDRIIERLMSSGDFVFFLDSYNEINSSLNSKRKSKNLLRM